MSTDGNESDIKELDKLTDLLETDELSQVFQAFQTDTTAALEECKESIYKHDLNQIPTHIEPIIPTAQMIGAKHFAAQLRELSDSSANRHPANLAQLLENINEEFSKLCAATEKML